MNLLDAVRSDFISHLAIFLRISSFLVAIPLFGPGVPSLAKLGLGALLTLLIRPVVPVPPLPEELLEYALVVVGEVAVGLAMGLVVTTVMAALYVAGQFIDVPMGFGMVNVVDPQTGAQIPVIAQFQFVIAMLLLFVVNGHHVLLRVLAESFVALPIGGAGVGGGMVEVVTQVFSAMFLLGLRIALPVMGALFIADVSLGIVARAVPQINVFFVGFPLKIALGFTMLTLILPAFVLLMEQVLGPSGVMADQLSRLVRALGSGVSR